MFPFAIRHYALEVEIRQFGYANAETLASHRAPGIFGRTSRLAGGDQRTTQDELSLSSQA